MLRVSALSGTFLVNGIKRLVIRLNSTSYTWTPSSEIPPPKKKKLSDMTPLEIETVLNENVERLKKSFEKDELDNTVVPIFKKSLLYSDQIAIKDSSGEYTYIQLYVSAKRLATQISNLCSSAALKNVAYLCANNVLSPLAQWACWMSGQVAVPLNMCKSPEMLKHLLKDAGASLLIATAEHERLGRELTQQLDISLIVLDHTFIVSPETRLATEPRLLIAAFDSVIVEGTFANEFYTKANAMLLYTPGTAGKPKGVMISHRNLDAQLRSLVRAWQFNGNDCLMHALPLNDAHGSFNAFLSPLSVGGRIVMHDHFNSHNVWSTLLGINTPVKERVTVFMAVPAIYNMLITEYEKTLTKNSKMVGYISNYCKENVRLMISSSAPLPPSIYSRWREITGHSILECYGTAEVGLALSNSSEIENERAGHKCQSGLVGKPLPNVRVRLVGNDEQVLVDCAGETHGKPDLFELKAKEENAITAETPQQVEDNKARERSFTNTRSTSNLTAGIIGKTHLAEYLFLKTARLLEALKVKIAMFHLKKTQVKLSDQKEIESTTHVANNEPSSPAGIFEETVNLAAQSHLSNTQSNKEDATAESKPVVGELYIAGPGVFKYYYGDPSTTINAFDGDYFKTGDLAIYQDNVFKILGRCNVDVFEIAGKKISSYDIESVLLEHPSIRDVSVVTIPHEPTTTAESQAAEKQIGPAEGLGVICVLNQEAKLDLEDLNTFCAKLLPAYLLPKTLKIVDELPRLNMAKINKQALRELLVERKVEGDP